MRILGPGRDYYDNVARVVLGGSADQEDPVYNRVSRTLKFVSYTVSSADRNRGLSEEYQSIHGSGLVSLWGATYQLPKPLTDCDLQAAALLFCGTLYTGYIYKAKTQDARFYTSVPQVFSAIAAGKITPKVWPGCDVSPSQLASFQKNVEAALTAPAERTRSMWAMGAPTFTLYAWETYVKRQVSVPDALKAHLRYESPVILMLAGDRDVTVEINPCLRNYGFQAVVDPNTAYQTLDQYLGNELARQLDPIPVRTQDLIRDAHGFDQTSFRKTADTRARKQR